MKLKQGIPEKLSQDAKLNILAINAKYSAEDKSRANQTGSDARLINNFSNLKENPDSWINGRTDRNVYGVGWEGSRIYDENTAKILKLQLVAINKETETVNKKSDSNSTKIEDYETKEETRKKKIYGVVSSFIKGAALGGIIGFSIFNPILSQVTTSVALGALNSMKNSFLKDGKKIGKSILKWTVFVGFLACSLGDFKLPFSVTLGFASGVVANSLNIIKSCKKQKE